MAACTRIEVAVQVEEGEGCRRKIRRRRWIDEKI